MTTNRSSGRFSPGTQGSFSGSNGEASISQASDIGEVSRNMLSRIIRTIDGDIIPRLMLAFDTSRAVTPQTPAVSDRLSESVDEFVHLLLTHDASIATNYVATLRSDGFPLAALYLDLLAPSARRLGEMWEDDLCSFTDVTIGVCRMHQVLLEFSRCFDATEGSNDPGQSALIIPQPGEQHTFGLFMVMEFLRRGGWNCWSGAPTSQSEFLRLVRTQPFDLVGISVSGDPFIEPARKLIAEIRKGPVSDDAVILLGGRAITENPDLVAELGADAMARDGREALRKANQLCRKQTGSSQ